MRNSQSLRNKLVGCLCSVVVATAFLPTVALGAEAELARKIDALQKELEAPRAQVNSQAAAPAAPAASEYFGPAGFELSIYGVGHLSADRIRTGSDSSGYVHSNSSRLGFNGS